MENRKSKSWIKVHKREAYGIKFTILEQKLLPPKGFAAINIFGFIWIRNIHDISEKTMRHECIHTLQCRELLYILHYLLYCFEWIIKLLICFNFDKAYRSVSLEQEAYENDHNENYKNERIRFNFIKYIFKIHE